jgi:sialate O-acetylesterase
VLEGEWGFGFGCVFCSGTGFLMRNKNPLIGAALLLAAFQANADVRLPKILSDHMVLQAGKPARIWGWADSGEKVTVELAGESASAVAGADGKWAVQIKLPAKGEGLEMKVSGKNSVKVSDILVGEVWVCSGQSNMEWTVAQSINPVEEAAAAKYPLIRHFKVPHLTADKPQEDLQGQWVVCSPETVPQFSAAGYFFGRELHQKLGVAVGLIGTNWGGTPAESWASRAALESHESLKPLLERWDTQVKGFDAAKAKSDFDAAMAKWKTAAEAAKSAGKPVPPQPRPAGDPAANAHRPANLYNAMIAPLLPLSIKGAIWYQGESNVGRAFQYRTIFPAMIKDWRKGFDQGDFPFLFVQIAPFNYNRSADADKSPCAELWEAQALTLSTVPNTGMAVTTDIGNLTDIHPKNKQEVGRRLALWALAKTYGKADLEYSGPLYKAAKVDGGSIRLSFDHGKGLKSANGKALSHFTVCGEDKKFVEAEAQVVGEEIVVKAASVAKPVAVRFAWREDAEPNLVNGAGLPASPFRTDSFPAVTQDKH